MYQQQFISKRRVPVSVEPLESRVLMHADGTLHAEPDWHVNAGGPNYTAMDGQLWRADVGFSGGAVLGGSASIASTSNDPLYNARRYGTTFQYALPLKAAGPYTLRLFFADTSFAKAGQRKFDVFAEGSQILNDYDIVAQVGPNAAAIKTFSVNVPDAVLNLSFRGVVSNATVSAIEVKPAGPTPTPVVPISPRFLTAYAASASQINLSWDDRSTNESGFRVERQKLGGSFQQIAVLGANARSYQDRNLPAGTYVYRVRAYNSAGSSPYGNEANAATSATRFTWTTGASGPVARFESESIQVGSKLYVMGGFLNNQLDVTNRVDILNHATMLWSTGKPLPTSQTHAAIATDGRFIYVAGGQVGPKHGTSTAAVWKYDTQDNTWAQMQSLPAARYGGTMQYVNGYLHFFGGTLADRVTVTGDHWRFKVSGGTSWERRASQINPGDHLTSAALNGNIYAIGGEHNHGTTYDQHDFLSVYDPASDSWKALTRVPKPSSHYECSVWVRNGKIVVFGGQTDDEVILADVMQYDPAANEWTHLTPLPKARKGTALGWYNGKIILTSGQYGDYFVTSSTIIGTPSN